MRDITSVLLNGLRDYGTGEWEGGEGIDCPDCTTREEQLRCKTCLGTGELSCDHMEIHPQNREGRETPGGRGGSFPTTERAYKTECGKCGARRVDQQIGLEETPDQWVERLVQVFREVRRVLRDDGTLWVEIGDSYGGGNTNTTEWINEANGKRNIKTKNHPRAALTGHKPKDLLGQPWLLAFALRADGWYLRSEIIWARPNPMPESVTDRPTKSHSTVFLLSKAPRYFYDADAIREPHKAWVQKPDGSWHNTQGGSNKNGLTGRGRDDSRGDTFARIEPHPSGANARSVWNIPTQPTPYAHFATWPEQLVRRMILAGTSEKGCCPECGAPWTRDVERGELVAVDSRGEHGWQSTADPGLVQAGNRSRDGHRPGMAYERETVGWASPTCEHYVYDVGSNVGEGPAPVPCTVLDPFAGSATTNLVARNTGRHSIGIELNHTYLQIAATRLQQLSLLT